MGRSSLILLTPCCCATGKNGYIWIGPALNEDSTAEHVAQQTVDSAAREKIARVRNSIIALARRSLSVFDTRCEGFSFFS
jgi:exosome complex RNA-binding protein Rrp4